MKLDYCNAHVAKGEKIEACLCIRSDDGKMAKPREVWAEIERLRNVAQAAVELMATLGVDGEICTLHPKTQILLDALFEWRPTFAEVSNVQIEAPSRLFAKVASNVGLGVAVPSAPTFEGKNDETAHRADRPENRE